ncbi:hypothetical protein HDU67_002274, partial [Dinochytrium kinnereticum]
WITEFSSSSGAFLMNSGGAFLSSKSKKDDGDESDEEEEEPIKRDPGGVLVFRILLKLNAVTYVMAQNPGMTAEEAHVVTLKMVGALDEEGLPVFRDGEPEGRLRLPDLGKAGGGKTEAVGAIPSSVASNEHSSTATRVASSTSPHPNPTTTSSIFTNPLLPLKPRRPTPAPASSDPPPTWAQTSITPELPHLLPIPYTTIGAIDDFLHCIERTSAVGFGFEDIRHPVSARHGSKDGLVPVAGVRGVGGRCGWRVEVFEGEGHDLRKSVLAEGFREVREVMGGLRVGGVVA